MKRKVRVFLSVVALVAVLGASVSAVTASGGVVTQEVETEVRTSSEPVEVLVTLREPTGVTSMEERKRAVERSQRELLEYAESTEGVRVLNRFWISNSVLLEVEPGFRTHEFLDVEDVRSVRSNTETKILDPVSDPGHSDPSQRHTKRMIPSSSLTASTTTTQTASTYGVEQINAPDVWSTYGTKGGGVRVAVLDTGVNVSHPDIELRTTNSSDPTYPGGWAEFDSQGNRVTGSEPHDTDGHGTHVSGTVAGDHTGVAPGVSLMHGLVVNGDTGTLSQSFSGMEWAIQNDADVITMSLGGTTEDAWIDAVENANNMGVVVVSSVGNGGQGTSASPGNVYDVISVGAVDSNLDVAGFSSGEVIDTDTAWGSEALSDWPDRYVVPDIVAAGVGVNSTSASGGYTLKSGTSMSAPHVAGAVALGLSASGGGGTDEIRNALRFTAFGSGSSEPDTRYGSGAADALAATEFLVDDASVSGSVVNGSGSPVDEVSLSVNGVRVGTDGGAYSLELSEGTWSLEASAPGYKATTATVNLAKDETVTREIVLSREEPATFEVGSLTGPSKAETGESVRVTATVRNTGDVKGTQDVTFRLNESGEPLDAGAVVGTRSGLTLGSGASTTVSFTVNAPSAEGDYDYGVFTDNSSATGSLTVKNTAPAFFEVGNLRAPTEAKTGETITATASVRNTGDVKGTQDVTFRLNESGEPLDAGAVVGTRSGLTLGSGASTTVSFSFDAPRNAGNFDHGIFTEDDSETASLTVKSPPDPAKFEVSGMRAPASVEEGEEFSVNATVENTGGQKGTQDVTFRLNESGAPLDGSSVVETQTDVSLGAGESTTVNFESLSVGENGTYDHGVFTEDDSAVASLRVKDRDPAFFEVDGFEAPTEAKPGENMTVNATIRNTGGTGGTQEVTYRRNSGGSLDGTAVVGKNRSVFLGPGQHKSVTITVETPDREGTYEHGVFTEDDNETASLTVKEPPEPAKFEVAGLEAPEVVRTRGSMNVAATIRNTGEVSGTQDVSFRLSRSGGTLDESTTAGTREDLSLAPGGVSTVRFTIDAPVERGTYDHGVFTEDDSAVASLRVKDRDPAFFEVDGFEAPTEAKPGENMTVNATIRNTGGTGGTQEVTYRRNETGEALDEAAAAATKGVSLSPGTSTSVEFVLGAPSEKGEYDHGIFTQNGSVTETFSVNPDDKFDLDRYRNPNGEVDTAGLQAAINDFLGGGIDTGDLQTAIRAFLNRSS